MWEERWRVRHEISVTWADGKGGPRLPWRKPEDTGGCENTGGGQLEASRTISAWHWGWGRGRSDGRGGAAYTRSYPVAMWWFNQRAEAKT